MRILVKYPTRSRPDQFLKTLEGYVKNAYNNSQITYLVSYDEDDKSMTDAVIASAHEICPLLITRKGKSVSKIEACNRDVNNVFGWDIILLASDDMVVQVKNWDKIIRDNMDLHFKDLDGCLWFHDGSTQKAISTLSCMGSKYYERFGYLYHPSYRSFFSDNEYTEIAQQLKKIIFIDEVIIKHEHPAWCEGIKNDALYLANNKNWSFDQNNYNQRKRSGFPLN